MSEQQTSLILIKGVYEAGDEVSSDHRPTMEGNTSWTVVVSEDFALGFGQAYTDAGPSNFSVYYGDNGQHEFKAHIDTLVQASKFFAWEFGIDLMV